VYRGSAPWPGKRINAKEDRSTNTAISEGGGEEGETWER